MTEIAEIHCVSISENHCIIPDQGVPAILLKLPLMENLFYKQIKNDCNQPAKSKSNR